MDDTILRVDDIQKFYGNKGNLTKAVDHISFSVSKGEFLGIMGSSGSGKTTLLNCISTIDTVTSGHIYVEEKDITTLHGSQLADFRGKKLGFIFQDFNLLDTLTAYENISLALSIAGTKPSEIQKCVPQIAKALNIQEVLNKYPYQMSGGQQQRVAAARAMVTNPAIVLADEPTGALDSNSSRMLLTMLTELNEQLAATILMVTHDAFSASYCHRILFIKDGQVFNELHRGTDTRKDFFAKILEVVSVLGGEQSVLCLQLNFRSASCFRYGNNRFVFIRPTRHTVVGAFCCHCGSIGFSDYLCQPVSFETPQKRIGRIYGARHEKKTHFPAVCR